MLSTVWEARPSHRPLMEVNDGFAFLEGPVARCIQLLKWMQSFLEPVKQKLEAKNMGCRSACLGDGGAGWPAQALQWGRFLSWVGVNMALQGLGGKGCRWKGRGPLLQDVKRCAVRVRERGVWTVPRPPCWEPVGDSHHQDSKREPSSHLWDNQGLPSLLIPVHVGEVEPLGAPSPPIRLWLQPFLLKCIRKWINAKTGPWNCWYFSQVSILQFSTVGTQTPACTRVWQCCV